MCGGERSVAEDALTELAGLTSTATSVGKREVVEHRQLAWTQPDRDLDGIGMQAPFCEEALLFGGGGELGAAQESGVGLDARQDEALAECGLHDPGQAAFDIALLIVPCPVACTVGGKAAHQLIAVRPGAPGKQRT